MSLLFAGHALTALFPLGHHEEPAVQVRAACTNGLTNDEIKELFLQNAIYREVPDAINGFRIAQQVLADLDAPDSSTAQPHPTSENP